MYECSNESERFKVLMNVLNFSITPLIDSFWLCCLSFFYVGLICDVLNLLMCWWKISMLSASFRSKWTMIYFSSKHKVHNSSFWTHNCRKYSQYMVLGEFEHVFPSQFHHCTQPWRGRVIFAKLEWLVYDVFFGMVVIVLISCF
jgi:hypothetical protein